MDPRLLKKIETLFAPGDRAEAERLVREECAELPFVGDGSNLLRVRAGVLMMSGGNLEKLRKSIDIRDWRSILVWSGSQDARATDDWLNNEGGSG